MSLNKVFYRRLPNAFDLMQFYRRLSNAFDLKRFIGDYSMLLNKTVYWRLFNAFK